MALNFASKTSILFGMTFLTVISIKASIDAKSGFFDPQLTNLFYNSLVEIKNFTLELILPILETVITNFSFSEIVFSLAFVMITPCIFTSCLIVNDNNNKQKKRESHKLSANEEKLNQKKTVIETENSNSNDTFITGVTSSNSKSSFHPDKDTELLKQIKNINTNLKDLIKTISNTNEESAKLKITSEESKTILTTLQDETKSTKESLSNIFKAISGLQQLMIYLGPEAKVNQLKEVQTKEGTKESRKH